MSKIIGSILIILSLLDFFNGFAKNSDFLINWFGPLAELSPFVIAVAGLMFFFWKTDESRFKSKKK
tara:strand:- start:47 stop:244 length:198 start_codon:yes stop_codon:yes gene_type:complete